MGVSCKCITERESEPPRRGGEGSVCQYSDS